MYPNPPHTQVLVVLFGTILGGAWFSQLQTLLDDPSSIWSQLGTSAAQSSVFFLNYVSIQAMVTSPLFWLRLPQLLILSIRVGLSYSERAKERVWQSRTIFYGAFVSGCGWHQVCVVCLHEDNMCHLNTTTPTQVPTWHGSHLP